MFMAIKKLFGLDEESKKRRQQVLEEEEREREERRRANAEALQRNVETAQEDEKVS